MTDFQHGQELHELRIACESLWVTDSSHREVNDGEGADYAIPVEFMWGEPTAWRVLMIPGEQVRTPCWYCTFLTAGRVIVGYRSMGSDVSVVRRVEVCCNYCEADRRRPSDTTQPSTSEVVARAQARLQYWARHRSSYTGGHWKNWEELVLNRQQLPQLLLDVHTSRKERAERLVERYRRLLPEAFVPQPEGYVRGVLGEVVQPASVADPKPPQRLKADDTLASIDALLAEVDG